MICNNRQIFLNLTACNYSYIQLIDFNARFYSPTLGRFIQPDSVVPEFTNSQTWNRYAYVLNNPINNVDPSGHLPTGADDNEVCLPGSYCDPLSSNSDGSNSGSGNDQPGDIEKDLESKITCETSSVTPSGIFICNLNEHSSLVVLPPNFDPVVERPVFLQNLGWGFSFIAALSDIVELVAIVTPWPGDEDATAFYDLFVSIASCATIGECRMSSMDPSLPNIVTINQEVIVAGADLATGLASSILQAIPDPVAGYLLANGPDAITTTLDLVHGVWKNNPFNIQENIIYLGVSVDLNSFGRVYVIVNLEE